MKKHRRNKFAWLLAAAIVFFCVGTAAEDTVFTVTQNHADALYKTGEDVVFTVTARTKDGLPLTAGKILWKIVQEDKPLELFGELPADGQTQTIKATFARPGTKHLYLTTAAANDFKIANGAAADLDKITSFLPLPADFTEFWRRKIALLDAIPPVAEERAEVTPDKPEDSRRVKVFDVKIPCAGGAPVSGLLTQPAAVRKKGHPAAVVFHGMGVYSSRIFADFASANDAIVFDVNAHGIENRRPPQYYRDLAQGRLKNYFLSGAFTGRLYQEGMVLRIVQALRYCKTLPEWDGKNLIVLGGSQGGMQALWAAGLDPDVSACIAGAPGFCGADTVLDGRMHSHAFDKTLIFAALAIPQVRSMLMYYDAAAFAGLIKCPAFVTAGFQDLLAPMSGIYAVYNRIPGSNKKIINVQRGLHDSSVCVTPVWEEAAKKIRLRP